MSNITLPENLQSQKILTFQTNALENAQGIVPVELLPLASGSLTAAGSAVVCDISNAASVAVIAAGTFSVTLTFEVSLDNIIWTPISLVQVATRAVYSVVQVAAVSGWVGDVVGWKYFRARCSTFVSGSCGVTVSPSIHPSGALSTDASGLAAGANTIGSVRLTTNTTGGASFYSYVSLATNNPVLVKSTAATLYKLHVNNNNVSLTRYIKVYTKSTAPVPGTDSPVMTLGISPNSTITFDFGDIGVAIIAGLGFAITGTAAPLDATAVGANEVTVVAQYV